MRRQLNLCQINYWLLNGLKLKIAPQFCDLITHTDTEMEVTCFFCFILLINQPKLLTCQNTTVCFIWCVRKSFVLFCVCLQGCLSGYRRVNGTVFKGSCEPCLCHSHASDCHGITGECLVSENIGIIDSFSIYMSLTWIDLFELNIDLS